MKARLLGSFTLFIQYFYKIRTGRDFIISDPIARRSHHILMAEHLTRVKHQEIDRLIINCPPRYGKTEMSIHFIAWTLAQFPSSNFLYVSYSHTLAKKQTQTVREIVLLRQYQDLFDIHLNPSTSAKDNFETTAGGSVYAAGAGGTITGRGAGIQNEKDFGGAIIIDDIHKPADIHSDTLRKDVIDWYKNTLQSRLNSPRTPILFVGQRLHEEDLPSYLMGGEDSYDWNTCIIPALDAANNALNPALHSKEKLLQMQEKMPYEFASQYQQTPQPAGGGIFKKDWFVITDTENLPPIFATFITVDSAETAKTYNDATAFSFWGLHKVMIEGLATEEWGLIWLDAWEIWVEPKDLQTEFINFWRQCMHFEVKPSLIGIEQKSTAVTLISNLKEMKGLNIHEISRNRGAGSKADRFLRVQPYVAQKLISLPLESKHTPKVIDHMSKITANDTHRYDDLADTAADAIQLGLMDKIVPVFNSNTAKQKSAMLREFAAQHQRRLSS